MLVHSSWNPIIAFSNQSYDAWMNHRCIWIHKSHHSLKLGKHTTLILFFKMITIWLKVILAIWSLSFWMAIPYVTQFFMEMKFNLIRLVFETPWNLQLSKWHWLGLSSYTFTQLHFTKGRLIPCLELFLSHIPCHAPTLVTSLKSRSQ